MLYKCVFLIEIASYDGEKILIFLLKFTKFSMQVNLCFIK